MTIFQDLRHGLRWLRRHLGFTVAAIAILAIGIGANTAIFSVIDTILLRRLPFDDPERIVTIWQNNTKTGQARADVSPPNFLDWREQARSFAAFAAAEPYSFDYYGGGEPDVIYSALVTERFFEAVGVRALYGRTFAPGDFRPGQHQVAVMSYGLWQRRFGGDRTVVGRTIVLDNAAYTVVGVLPPECQLRLFDYEAQDLWAPKIIQDRERAGPRSRASLYWNVVARLKPGVSLDQARAEMETIAGRLAQQYPDANGGMGVTLVPLHEQLFGHVRPALLVLLTAVGLVLLIACANVANLLLARGATRERELAIRAAMGATRARLVRQLLVEATLIAALGCGAGMLLARWGIGLILLLSPADLPYLDQVQLDWRVLGFALGVSVFAALLFGVAPSAQLSRFEVQESLSEGGRTAPIGSRRHRLRAALVVAEIALALVLLVGAGLLVRSFRTLLEVDPGFRKDNLLALQVFAYDRATTPAKRVAFFRETLSRVEALPGVESAAAVMAPPFFLKSDMAIDVTFVVDGQPPPPPDREPHTFVNIVTPTYFSVMGVPLRRGRMFTDHDATPGQPVALINDTMARLYWPNEDPVGKTLPVRYGGGAARQIIGVVGHVRHGGLDSEPRPEVFLPHAQSATGSMTYVVRTRSDPWGLMQAVKDQVWTVDKLQTFYSTGVMQDLIDTSLAGRRFSLMLLAAFAGIALLLSAVGLYGVISFLATQRTQEIGVRMALGASRRDIIRMIVGQSLTLVMTGIALGLAASLVVTRFLQGLLFGITPTDVPTFMAVTGLLFVVALLASYIPARRATRVDPMVALRAE